MTLNRRHKTILFLNLVFNGCALLSGVELKEILGFMMLGVAVAWAAGSDAASKLYSAIKGASGTLYSWVRLPLVMALAGGLLGAVLLYSRANPVVAVVLMCAAGVIMAPFTPLPTRKPWLRIVLIFLAGGTFLVAAGTVSLLGLASTDLAARLGELVATGLIALLVGIFWLSKGWRLIQTGIAVSPSTETLIPTTPPKRAIGQYISLFLGLMVLTLCLSSLAWVSSINWAFAPEKVAVTEGTNNLLVQAALIVLLAWWPYHSWKSILSREPNSQSKYLLRHRRITVVAGVTFLIVQSLAVTYGIQSGNDRRMNEKINSAIAELRAVATKIGAIKQRDLRTTDDYLQAYAEIETLLPEFESDLQKCSDSFDEAHQMDMRRGLINAQVFYRSRTPEAWKNSYKTLDLLRRFDSLTRQEVLTVHKMAALPGRDQVAFWQNEFQPLLVQERNLSVNMQGMASKTQPSR
jgi:hypothetical protein